MNSSNGGTPERRARQAERIKVQKPWLQSTGPKSAAGKALVARNAFKGGHWRVMRDMARHVNECLQEQQRLLEQF